METRQLAQVVNPVLPPGIGSGANTQGPIAVGRFISSLVSVFLVIAALASLIFLVVGGVQWVLSGGDKAQLESARNRILHALLGLVVVASAWAIWTLVGNYLGWNVEQLPFPTLE